MKTTQSSFIKFCKDEYTTLPEVEDRLVGTVIAATWTYAAKGKEVNYQKEALAVRNALVNAFAGPADVGTPSPAVQFTLYQMANAVLAACASVMEITINMPNVHNLPLDQSKFGLKNEHPHGEIFVPVDEPHGIIEATVSRTIPSRM